MKSDMPVVGMIFMTSVRSAIDGFLIMVLTKESRKVLCLMTGTAELALLSTILSYAIMQYYDDF